MRCTVILAALALGACCTTPSVIEPAPIPKPASCTAPVEDEPQPPTITQDQRDRIDDAYLEVLGWELAVPFIRHQRVEFPGYADRLRARVEDSREWCNATE